MKNAASQGIHHIIVFGDFYSVYAFDPVIKSPIRRILTKQININALAVDPKRQLLFVNQYDRSAYSSNLTMYTYTIDLEDSQDPKMTLQVANATDIFYGGLVTDLAIDSERGFLLISDAKN